MAKQVLNAADCFDDNGTRSKMTQLKEALDEAIAIQAEEAAFFDAPLSDTEIVEINERMKQLTHENLPQHRGAQAELGSDVIICDGAAPVMTTDMVANELAPCGVRLKPPKLLPISLEP